MNETGDNFLSTSSVKSVTDEVRSFGLLGLETGGFLLMPRGAATISIVALAGDTGIVRRRDLFQISARALDRLFTFADERDLWVPTQFHSHRQGAFLSIVDKSHGLSVEGFISIVVPRFVDPQPDPRAWGWWQNKENQWVEVAPWNHRHGGAEVVRFDEDGVRAA